MRSFHFRPVCLFFQDLYVYVTQDENFSEFNETESLLWYQRDLVYGDWATGDNRDGCYELYQEMDIPEVGGAELGSLLL